MSTSAERDQIWLGDKLHRRNEADVIERFLPREVAFFKRMGRAQSIVLAVDGEYGRGKSWFLERLAKQLSLSHPVAVVDAWADDVGDEPLTAFMAAIDDSLAPYLKKSKKLSDRMAAAKAAALPVIGKLFSGAAVKALSKIAGDEIDEHLGQTIETAIRGAKGKHAEGEEGVAAEAMNAAFEKLSAEIDSLVDRRGAAMLEAYRQRKASRDVFRKNMAELVSAIDNTNNETRSPLFVVIDELDRCRPSYAIKMLEEIKHFFEIPGVVFIIGLHGAQLSKSVNAIYGSEFDSESYLRRFFTRRFELRAQSIVELVASVFEECGIDGSKLSYPKFIVNEGYPITEPRMIGLILGEWHVTPREVYPIIDGLRLFIEGWEHSERIEPMALLSLLVNLVRGKPINFVQPTQVGHIKLEGVSWNTQNSGNPSSFLFNDYLTKLTMVAWDPLSQSTRQGPHGHDPATNYAVAWLHEELQSRQRDHRFNAGYQSYFADYIPRIYDLARFVEKPDIEAQ